MCRLTIAFVCIAICLSQAPDAFAQHVAVQQPSLETFGVGTTVSAPDRGRTSAGGIARGKSSGSTYGFGPLRSGTNMGLSSQSTSVGVGVRVHDLAEMDRQAIAAADRARRTRDAVSLSPSAERAYETLRARSTQRDVAIGAGSAIVTTGPRAPSNPNSKAAGPAPEIRLDRRDNRMHKRQYPASR